MLDERDEAILAVLQRRGRATFSDIGKEVGLSPSTVHERVRKLEQTGVVRGYRAEVLGDVPRIGIEAAVEGDWARWLGDAGEFVGMTGFGASAPAETLYREFDITADAVARAALRCIARSRMTATRA